VSYTTPAEELKLKKWRIKYWKDFVRESGFMPYMGMDETACIQVLDDLIEGGQILTVPLVSSLKGNGTGTGTLVGNEEALYNKGYDLKPYWRRHAVTFKKSAKHESVIDLADARRNMLKIWDKDKLRDDTINALTAVVEESSAYDEMNGHPKQIPFSEASTANKNTWAAANQNRIVPGATLNNYSATYATMADTLDTTADTFTVEKVQLMKRVAKKRDKATGRPSVRPLSTGDQGRENFVCFAHSLAFRDLQADMETINLDGRPRDVESNPLFQDGDLLIDGVVIREIPELYDYGQNTGSVTVVPAFLCGAQALGLAWGQKSRLTRRKEDDYDFIDGVGTEALYAVEKIMFTPPGASAKQDHGIVTGLFATAAD
jgi:hypothetical protein